MKREYPLFLIDRSKHSTYPFEYIICLDKEVGFIARVAVFHMDEPFNLFVEKKKEIKHGESASITFKFKKSGGLVVAIEDFLYSPILDSSQQKRVRVLLKKALKKYLYAEVERSISDDLSIENQIKQQELTIERAKANYDDLLERSGYDKELADHQIALAEATLETLLRFRNQQNFFIEYFN